MPIDIARRLRELIDHMPESSASAVTPAEIGARTWPHMDAEKASKMAGLVLGSLERNKCVEVTPCLFRRYYWLNDKGAIWRRQFVKGLPHGA